MQCIHQIESKPFLRDLFYQTASQISSSLTTSDDKSHISDYRTQPRADSRAIKPERLAQLNLSNKDNLLSNIGKQYDKSSTSNNVFQLQRLIGQRNDGNYSEVIGNIIEIVRERITSVFQQFLSPVRNQETEQQNDEKHKEKGKMITTINDQISDIDVSITSNNSSTDEGKNMLMNQKLQTIDNHAKLIASEGKYMHHILIIMHSFYVYIKSWCMEEKPY